MAKRKKACYAIANGHSAPLICSSWGVAQPLVDGYKNNNYKGFETLPEAREWMDGQGHSGCPVLRGDEEGARAPAKGEPHYYAVANGENIGVYERYRSGAEAQVTNHPHSCHKLFGSQKAGERFIEEYKTTVLWKKETQGGDDIERLSDLMSRL